MQRRIVDPLLKLSWRGMSADHLAISVAIAVVVGNIPIFGISTILCAAIALVFRLNLPAIQIAQAVMAPTQLLLIIPFVRLGEWLMHAPRQAVSIKAMLAFTAQDIGRSVVVLRDVMIHASVAWMLIAPFAIFSIYRLLAPAFRRAAADLFRKSQAEQP